MLRLKFWPLLPLKRSIFIVLGGKNSRNAVPRSTDYTTKISDNLKLCSVHFKARPYGCNIVQSCWIQHAALVFWTKFDFHQTSSSTSSNISFVLRCEQQCLAFIWPPCSTLLNARMPTKLTLRVSVSRWWDWNPWPPDLDAFVFNSLISSCIN